MGRSYVGIVIPALNESKTIRTIVESARVYGVPIVVDDGSTDNTSEVSLQAGAVVVVHEKNQGYDAALNSGFLQASALGVEIIITIDADGQHDPTLIQRFVDGINAGADLVVGVRSRKQRVTEHLFAWYTKLRFGLRDPLCGMKAYRTHVYLALGHFDSYRSIGTELTIFGARNGYRVAQIEFEVRERSGKSRFGQMLAGNYKIVRAMVLSFQYVKII